MGIINYNKIIKQLLEEYPHEIDKVEKVVNDAKKNGQHDFNEESNIIIKNYIWNADEKARLLTIFGYNKVKHNMKYMDAKNIRDYECTLYTDNLSGFDALMKIYKNSCNGYVYTDEDYKDIFDSVIKYASEENSVIYIKTILANLEIEDIKRLMRSYYEGNNINSIHNRSIFINIIATKNLDLIKNYIAYIDNISIYLPEAVATGNIEIVKFFLEKGANINYLADELICDELAPLKTAIVNNDYEMAKFLLDNGADVNLQIQSENLFNKFNNKIDALLLKKNIESFNETDQNYKQLHYKQLQYLRESSPLEFATKLREKNYKFGNCYNVFNIYFKGESYNVKNELLVNTDNISEEIKNRGKIVDLIFDKLEDKVNINYNDLLGFTFITRDSNMFKKYWQFAIDNNYQIDFDMLFKLYFELHLEYDKEMTVTFLDLIDNYDNDNDIFLKFFDYYLNMNIKNNIINSFYINDFNKELLNKISEEKRKNIFLVPYCRDLKSLMYLLSLGFDINQVDEKGRNILYYLFQIRFSNTDLNAREIELFNYLLENVDLSLRDKSNKTMLYYAMQSFKTDDEYLHADKEKVETKSNLEKAVVMLISKMKQEEVCNDDINKVLEERLNYSGKFGDKIHFEYVYQYHKELFEALINKGFILSDNILNEIFAKLYPSTDYEKEQLVEKIDMDNTLKFLYQKLDRNLEIQELDIDQEFNNLMFNVDKLDITFDEFIRIIDKFNKQIISLKQFYENNIKKRFNPEMYLQYAREKYHTIYEGLDNYLLFIIIKGIRKYGNDKLPDILNLLPNYDINSYVINEDIEMGYWEYFSSVYNQIDVDENENPVYDSEHFEAYNVYINNNDNVAFTGGLMQYAILIDNLPMVKFLQKKGANLKFLVNGKDYTWDYVNSYKMSNYIEYFVGKQEHSDFNDDEKDYYLKLVNPTMKDSN